MQHTSPPTGGLHVSKEHLETLKLGNPVRIPVPELGADVVMVLAMPSESVEAVLTETLADLQEQNAVAAYAKRVIAETIRNDQAG